MSIDIQNLQKQCQIKGLNLTESRRIVYEILSASQHAMGAYDILEELSKRGMKSQPPIAYRALDFLMEHGFVHKLESKNAYVICDHPETPHQPVFFICCDCSTVFEETNPVHEKTLENAACEQGFEIMNRMIEVEGRCERCAEGKS